MSFLVVRMLAVASLIGPLVQPSTPDLRITDSKGTEVVVSGAVIDYSGLISPDKETQGIRVSQGDGLVLVKWTDLETLRVSKADSATKPPRVTLDVTMRSGKRVSAELFRKGQMVLTGKTDLGDYSIELDKIRAIAPVK